jgi:hypothetical protein
LNHVKFYFVYQTNNKDGKISLKQLISAWINKILEKNGENPNFKQYISDIFGDFFLTFFFSKNSKKLSVETTMNM